MIGTTRIQGADKYANNASAGFYTPQLQASTGQRSKLHKVVVSNLGASGDVYLWVCDLAAGATPTGPRMVMLCPNEVCTTLDLGDGTPFINGIQLTVLTTAPANASTVGTTWAANNAAIIDASYRLE